MTASLNYEAVYRTAPATPGLLTIGERIAIICVYKLLLVYKSLNFTPFMFIMSLGFQYV